MDCINDVCMSDRWVQKGRNEWNTRMYERFMKERGNLNETILLFGKSGDGRLRLLLLTISIMLFTIQ